MDLYFLKIVYIRDRSGTHHQQSLVAKSVVEPYRSYQIWTLRDTCFGIFTGYFAFGGGGGGWLLNCVLVPS